MSFLLCYTCSDVDIPGLDPPEFVLRPAPVGPGVNLLLVVAGLEGREDEVAVVHHLEIQQSTPASVRATRVLYLFQLSRCWGVRADPEFLLGLTLNSVGIVVQQGGSHKLHLHTNITGWQLNTTTRGPLQCYSTPPCNWIDFTSTMHANVWNVGARMAERYR